jgi:hypothetical protein
VVGLGLLELAMPFTLIAAPSPIFADGCGGWSASACWSWPCPSP